jgi:hypothetical protein
VQALAPPASAPRRPFGHVRKRRQVALVAPEPSPEIMRHILINLLNIDNAVPIDNTNPPALGRPKRDDLHALCLFLVRLRRGSCHADNRHGVETRPGRHLILVKAIYRRKA